MVSNQLKYLFKQLAFSKTVLVRILILIFKKNKNIELLELSYDTEFLFSNSLIIIRYNFNNTLWYSFNGKKTLEKKIKIFNLENINSNIEFTVFGLFRKRKYSIQLNPTLEIDNSNFKTKFSNLNLNINDHSIPILSVPILNISLREISIKASNFNLNNKPFSIQHNNFNQNEFI